MKFNIPFSDIFTLKVRRLPAYDVRWHLISWRTMSLSNKLRRIMYSEAPNLKQRFLHSMAPRSPLSQSTTLEDIQDTVKKITIGRSKSLPPLSTTKKELTALQVSYLKSGFKAAFQLTSSFSHQKLSGSKWIKSRSVKIAGESFTSSPKLLHQKNRHTRKTHHLGVSKMSLVISKKKTNTASRFNNSRKHPPLRDILPLYKRWRKSYHVEEYWKYTKDRRPHPTSLFDANINEFFNL